MKDIENRDDIETLIKAFYEKMLDDMVLGFIFTDIAGINLDEHLTVICDFWETVLFSIPKYKRGTEVLKVHEELNKKIRLKQGHFKRWLYLFTTTVDDNFEGDKANLAKRKANQIADSMQKKLNG